MPLQLNCKNLAPSKAGTVSILGTGSAAESRERASERVVSEDCSDEKVDLVRSISDDSGSLVLRPEEEHMGSSRVPGEGSLPAHLLWHQFTQCSKKQSLLLLWVSHTRSRDA